MDTENKILGEDELEEVNGGRSTGKVVAYTVQRGDNLTRIANHYKTTISAIMKLNHQIKDKNFIMTGWVLQVPDNR